MLMFEIVHETGVEALNTCFSVQQFTCERSIINSIIIFVLHMFLVLCINKMIISLLVLRISLCHLFV